MSYRLFIDDLRMPAEDDFVIVRNSKEAMDYVINHGCPDFISFDHDLGGDDTAIVFLNQFIDHVLDGKTVIPDDFSYFVHSANPVGAENISSKMDGFLKFINKNG